ncbi:MULTISPECIES: hypothetical protein [unclassified Nocardioides]|uniref:hypothetical protein n=1 Tax=unclassified Nocardioides TaxID=2615069 RepID=UPI0009F14547|nr:MULTISPECIES: hypothetical protein [unclassified Nocardioides]GAW50625.1 ATP-dependent RNA helicase dbp9 [Nocardioides sp. PD653-B2]GAW55524.1 ATP-dependent RNA helicase dbp9 [Nocardioides sp. PD653]
MSIWNRRRARLAESREALAKQERLGEYVQMQHQEAQELGEWARTRLRQNHLTQLFYDPQSKGA